MDRLGWNNEKTEDVNPERPKMTPEEVTALKKQQEQNRKDAQAFIDRASPLFQTIAGDTSLQFRVGDGFYIDLEKGMITFDQEGMDEMREGGLSAWQIIWAAGHEIGHFLDLRQNPKGMLAHFEYMRNRAKALVPQALEILIRVHGEEAVERIAPMQKAEDGTLVRNTSGLEQFLYSKIHLLYNCLNDMYVNVRIGERVPVFAPGGTMGPEIKKLYATYLFPPRHSAERKKKDGAEMSEADAEQEEVQEEGVVDYRKMPKCHQFAYALLRKRMVSDEEVRIAEDVAELLDGYPSEFARRRGFNLRKRINDWTTPGANGKEFNPRTKVVQNRELDPEWRYNLIKTNVEPTFVKLLMEDLEKLEIPPPPNESDAGSDWEEMDKKPEFGGEAVKQFVDQQEAQEQKAKAKKAEENKTPDQRASEARARADQKMCEGAGINPEAAKRYRELEAEIAPYTRQMAEIFEEFMRTIEERVTSYLQTGYTSGKENIRYLINKYAPELAMNDEFPLNPDELRHFARLELIGRMAIYPNDFRVRLVVDGSGSMSGDRMEMARKVIVLLLESLGSFQETINLKYRMQKPFVVDTQVRMFGSGEKVVKPFVADVPSAQGEAAKFAALEEVHANYGATYDAPSFEAINADIGEARAKKLKEGNAKELILYIADGGSQTAEETRKAIEAIQAKGAVCKGLLIGEFRTDEEGNVLDDGPEIFASMFGEHGKRVPEVGALAGVVLDLLKNEIQNTAIRVSAYEDVGSDSDV